jgi:PII-like signaling protein
VSTAALKLTVYFGERDRAGRRFLADALLDVCGRRGLAASVLLRGAAGFGIEHHLRTDRLLTLSEDLPLVLAAVDVPDRIRPALRELAALVGDGLVTVERARTGDPAQAAGEGTKLTLYAARGGDVPRQAVAALRRHGAAGATVLAGVDGTLHGRRRRARLFGANAQVPVMLVSVGDGPVLAQARAELERLLPGAVATVERARVCKRDGVRLAEPHRAGEAAGMWQQLSIYTGEQARHRGRPLGEQLVHRLRTGGAAGVTLLRGTWGYHGDHEPHGDRLGALRRNVPLVAVAVDAPERAARWFDVIDELTDEAGLVTSELVPAFRATGPGIARGGLEPVLG